MVEERESSDLEGRVDVFLECYPRFSISLVVGVVAVGVVYYLFSSYVEDKVENYCSPPYELL